LPDRSGRGKLAIILVEGEPQVAQRARPGRKRQAPALAFGLILIVAGSLALFWNEWRSASAVATLVAGERHVVDVPLEQVPAGDEGGLMHLAGPARPDGPAVDPLFGIGDLALRLDRKVEMHQWREIAEKGSANDWTYRYETVWAEGRIQSERFRERLGHVNPPAPTVTSERFYPEGATLGAYGLGRELLDRLPASRPVPIDASALVYLADRELRSTGGALRTGTPGSDRIGDLKVTFSAVPPGEISVLAGLDGSNLRPWQAANGGTVAVARPGLLTAEAMFREVYGMNSRTTWLVRAGATFALVVGYFAAIRPLARLLPPLGVLAHKAGKRIALTLALGHMLVVVALAWVVFRPMAGLALLAVGGGLVTALRRWRALPDDERLGRPPEPPPPG
jgi:hypothetical protein